MVGAELNSIQLERSNITGSRIAHLSRVKTGLALASKRTWVQNAAKSNYTEKKKFSAKEFTLQEFDLDPSLPIKPKQRS